MAKREAISLFTSDFWLVFNIPQLNGWLLVNHPLLVPLAEYKVLEEFIQNLLIMNNLVEEGIHLASDYNNRVHTKEQRGLSSRLWRTSGAG